MEKKYVYKVTIHNDDETVLYFIAKNKLDATCKYADYVKENRHEGYLDEEQDFKVEFAEVVFE